MKGHFLKIGTKTLVAKTGLDRKIDSLILTTGHIHAKDTPQGTLIGLILGLDMKIMNGVIVPHRPETVTTIFQVDMGHQNPQITVEIITHRQLVPGIDTGAVLHHIAPMAMREIIDHESDTRDDFPLGKGHNQGSLTIVLLKITVKVIVIKVMIHAICRKARTNHRSGIKIFPIKKGLNQGQVHAIGFRTIIVHEIHMALDQTHVTGLTIIVQKTLMVLDQTHVTDLNPIIGLRFLNPGLHHEINLIKKGLMALKSIPPATETLFPPELIQFTLSLQMMTLL